MTGDGVLLNYTLIQYGLQFLVKRGYQPIQPPFMMTAESMAKTAQLSEFDDLLYSVGSEVGDGEKDFQKKYLIATSEQPISCFHQYQWINKKQFPIRYVGVSTCFRKEAGSHGKDVRGLFRVSIPLGFL